MGRKRAANEPVWMQRHRLGLCTHCGLPLKGREAYAVDNTGQRYEMATCKECTAKGFALKFNLNPEPKREPPWLVVIVREGVPEIVVFTHEADAQAHFDKASAQWSDSFLARAVKAPRDWKGTP